MGIDNYYSDPRVRARDEKWWNEIDERRMVARFSLPDEDGCDAETEETPIRFEVCQTCDGRGRHVNPSIDCNGLAGEDFAEDPDLAEAYMSGALDVTCYGCGGARVVPVPITEAVQERLNQFRQDQADYAAERAAETRVGA